MDKLPTVTGDFYDGWKRLEVAGGGASGCSVVRHEGLKSCVWAGGRGMCGAE